MSMCFSGRSVLFLFSLFFVGSTLADTSTLASPPNVWQDRSEYSLSQQARKSSLSSDTLAKIDALKYRALTLDEITFREHLLTPVLAARNASSNTQNESAKTIRIPLPEGGEVVLNAIETSILAPELARQLPQIKTWKVSGANQAIKGRIDFTDNGFHAMLLMPDGDTVFIEPDRQARRSGEASHNAHYLSISKRANPENFKHDFKCAVHKDSHGLQSFAAKTPRISARLLAARPAADIITYRLAVAATGEYTQFFGGTKASALSAIVTTINRVNLVFERDLSIRFELVPQALDLIYLNPITDPYSNDEITDLINENISNLSASGVLSTSEYDIGHVFGAGNVGGLAYVGATCVNQFKAGGATGSANPIGDAFSLDYVAHEIGHQMGATHTFNSACNDGSERTAQTAVEPGSGSTIMSYAGICPGNNLQADIDPQFHAVSIDQISNYSRSQGGSFCGTRQIVANQNPIADAGLDLVVPARTPLAFFATGTDADGDSLSYSWEQSDIGSVSSVDIDLGNNALFRSRLPSTSNVRYIPSIDDLLSGVSSKGERLPITNRNITMALTVRDERGGVEIDTATRQVHDTGSSFSITTPNTIQNYVSGNQIPVRWNVAGTNVSPISCANVTVSLVSGSGVIENVATTVNDGAYSLTVPASIPLINNARVMVSCSNGSFFNISSVDLVASNSIAQANEGGSDSGGGLINLLLLPLSLILLLRLRRRS